MDIEYEMKVPVNIFWHGSSVIVLLHIHKKEGEPFLTIQVQPLFH